MTIRTKEMQVKFEKNFEKRRKTSRECSDCGALRLYGHGCTHCGKISAPMIELQAARKQRLRALVREFEASGSHAGATGNLTRPGPLSKHTMFSFFMIFASLSRCQKTY